MSEMVKMYSLEEAAVATLACLWHTCGSDTRAGGKCTLL